MDDTEVARGAAGAPAQEGGAGVPRRRRFAVGRRARMILVVVGALFLLLALVGLGAHFYSAGRPVTLGTVAAAPYLMVGAPIGLILLLVGRQWIGAAVAVLLVVACVSTQSRLFIASPPPPGGHRITVMTSNLRLGQADAGAVVAAVRRHQVDVLMTEELTPEMQQRLIGAGLKHVLPYSLTEPAGGGNGTGLWSRYPLSEQEHVRGFSFAMERARVAVPGYSPQPTFLALHMSGPVPYSVPWQYDIRHLPSVLDALPRDAPVIAGGDFNATQDTSQFRKLLRDGYRDAADQAGAGLIRTYPANRWFPPLIGIDHVLTRDAVGTSADTVEIPQSDHRALVTRISLAPPG